VRIGINPNDDWAPGRILTQPELEDLWAGWEFWGNRIQERLTKKYGQPERTRPQFTYGGDDESDNAWRWRSRESLVMLYNRGPGRWLNYYDDAMGPTVELAEELYQEAEDRAQLDRF
jgi:hypothetical protein